MTNSGTWCPSSSAELGSVVIAIRRSGERPRMLPVGVPVPVELRSKPWATQHVRIAGPCQGSRCGHWDDGCSLGRMVALSAVPGGDPSTCPITDQCRWLAENGPVVCSRCPDLMRENS